MKKLGYLVALLLSLASPALAQGPAGLIVGQTPVIGGAPGQCLDILSGGRLGATTCGTGGSGVDSFSAGITGLTPNSATTGNVVLGGLLSATNGGTGVDNTGKSITLGGVLTTQGAFTTTLTVTGNTSVTLPTSGTLATVGATTSSFSGGTTGLVPSSPTTGAIVLSGTLVGANGGTGVNNSGKTITLGGNLVTTSALTLPTTVASLAGNTFTAAQLVPNGSVSTPSVAFSSEPSTGFYRSDVKQFAISVFGDPIFKLSEYPINYPNARLNLTSNLGVIDGGGKSSVGYLQELTFSGNPDETGSIFGTRRLMNPSGDFGIPIMMIDYKGIIDDATTGHLGLAYGSHNYIWNNGGQTIDNARVYFGHFRNDGTAPINLGIVFYAGETVFTAPGTGTIPAIIGFATAGDMGDIAKTASVTGFQFSGTDASGTIKGFYSTQAKSGNKYYNLFFDHDAPSWMLGNFQIGGTASSGNTNLRVEGDWSDPSQSFQGLSVNANYSTNPLSSSRLLFLTTNGSARLGVDVNGSTSVTGDWSAGGSYKALSVDAAFVTQPASDSRLLFLTVNGSTRFGVDINGNTTLAGGGVFSTVTNSGITGISISSQYISSFSGNADSSTDQRGLSFVNQLTGANSIAANTVISNQSQIRHTAGTVALSIGSDIGLTLGNAGSVTGGVTSLYGERISIGNQSAASAIATASAIFVQGITSSGGSGTYVDVSGMVVNNLGGVSVTGTATGVNVLDISGITGGGVVAGFRTNMASGTNKWAFLSTGSAPSQFGGSVLANNLQQVSPQGFGATGNGSTNDYTAFVNFYSSSIATKVVPAGTYALNTQWVPPKQVVSYTMTPGATFGGGTASPTPVDWSSVIEFQVGPVWTSNLYFQQFDSSFNGYGNIFSAAFQAENIGATAPTVALFAHGKAGTGSAGNVWGANIVATSSVNGSNLFGLEVNLAQGVNSGFSFNSAIGVMIGSAGFSATTAGLVIQSNTAAAQWDKAIWFHNRTGISAAATTYLIFSDATEAGHPITAGMDFRAAVFSSIDIGTKNFAVRGGNSVNYLDVLGGATTVNPTITCTGTDTNVGCIWNTKGTGVHNIEVNSVTQLIVGNTNAADSIQIQAGAGFGLVTSRGSSTSSSVLLRGKSAGGVILQDGGAITRFAVSPSGSVVTGNLGVGAQSTPTSVLDVISTITLASWTSTGPGLALKGGTMTDNSGTGTIATRVGHSVSSPTFASSSAVTLTEADTFYIAGAPTAGTNTTITKGYAFRIGAGDALFGGAITTTATLATAAPAGSTAGLWKLGALQTGAVVLDTTRSVYVDIGGTVYHLMVSQ